MSKVYQFILKVLKPFVVWWGKLHLPFTHKKINGKHYYLLRDKINIGTVLLTTTYGEFSNLINPEKIKHAGIYVGDIDNTGIRYVVEAVGRGVVKTDLVTFLTTKDLVIGCEPTFLDIKDTNLIPYEAQRVLGIPYDYLFEHGSKAMYCFETIAHIFKMVRPEIQLKEKEVVKGKKIYSYETYLKDSDKFNIVFNSEWVK